MTTISRENNIFMVGDVKQSIYKFRQARPELFIEKYETYKLKDDKLEQDNLKIQLFKNFRSRQDILNITNNIFENIMTKELGNIDYRDDEFLKLGSEYPDNVNKNCLPELYLIDLEKTEESEETREQILDTVVIEAKFVAQKIKELIDSKYQVFDKIGKYRDVTYKDIVVLLRTTSNVAPIYEKEISNLNMPVFSDVGEQYLDSIESETILSLLKILDNPIQDISLVTVLRSMIGGFSEDELMQIRLVDRSCTFYEVILKAIPQVENNLKIKIQTFLELIENLRKDIEIMSIDELIWKIYIDTGYFNYVSLMPNGMLRQANLKLLFQEAKKYQSSNFKGLFNFINFMDRIKTSNGDVGSAKLIGENENVIRIMSIHKSKGLEFPIVFLSGLEKQFNFQDLNQSIILHQDIGFGPQYIDSKRKIEYATIAKNAIKVKAKQETLSEEMRILYVALTRSKEKLILTGISKHVQDDLKEKKDMLKIYSSVDERKINSSLVKKYKSYLDWIELVYLNSKEKSFELNIVKEKDFIKDLKEEQVNEDIISLKGKINKDISELLNWNYKYKNNINIPTKTSVSSIKSGNIVELKLDVPKFLSEQVKLTNAEKGTAMHICLQRLNPKVEYTEEMIKNLIDDMVLKQIFTVQEANSIDVKVIYKFTKSELWNDMKQAKQVYKEQPFYISLSADIVYEETAGENVLVQGIIDLYYIDKDDKLILVDYKTDFVKNGNEIELIEKYKSQLALYSKALEQVMNKKVERKYIYSTCLDKMIECN